MKKIFNLIAVTLLLLGCSSGDGKVEPTLSYFNISDDRIKGFWYVDKVIQADGTIEDYIHLCSTERDKVDFQYNRIQMYYHYSDCEMTLNKYCTSFINVNFTVSACIDLFNGTYSYTNTNNNPTLRVDYAEVESLMMQSNNLDAVKGLIFSRD